MIIFKSFFSNIYILHLFLLPHKICWFSHTFFTLHWGSLLGNCSLNYFISNVFTFTGDGGWGGELLPKCCIAKLFSLGPTPDFFHSPKTLTRKSKIRGQPPESLPFIIPLITFKVLDALSCSSPPVPGKFEGNSFKEKQIWF